MVVAGLIFTHANSDRMSWGSHMNTILKTALFLTAALMFSGATAYGQQEEVVNGISPDAGSIEDIQNAADYIDSLQMEENVLTWEKVNKVDRSYGHVDPNHIVPDKLLAEALAYYQDNLSKISNKKYLSVIDFSAHSSQARFFIINMDSGAVFPFHVAHGSGSDANHDGYADKFSNTPGSNASSLGYYMTAETYSGKNGYSLRLDGLSSTNSKARARAVVVHGAKYVYDSETKAGRSQGCPAVSMANRTKVIDMIKGGSIIFAGLSK